MRAHKNERYLPSEARSPYSRVERIPMLRWTAIAAVVATMLVAAVPAFAAAAQTTQPAAPARPAAQIGNLFTVNAVKIDATAESAILARDAAMAQGRAQAF